MQGHQQPEGQSQVMWHAKGQTASTVTHLGGVVKLKVKTKNQILTFHLSIFFSKGGLKYYIPLPHTCTQPGLCTEMRTLIKENTLRLLLEECEMCGAGLGTITHLSLKRHRK